MISAMRRPPTIAAPLLTAPVSAPIAWTGLRFQHYLRGPMDAPILVVCDPPQPETYQAMLPMSRPGLEVMARHAKPAGFSRDDFLFVGLCPPIPEEAADSTARTWAVVTPHIETLMETIHRVKPRCIVTFGGLATRAVIGRAVAITRARGTPVTTSNGIPVFPMLSPGFVLKVPEHLPTFHSDFDGLRRFMNAGCKIAALDEGVTYEWREDISDILANPPTIIGLDTETTGLTWYDPRIEVLIVQFSIAEKRSILCPVHVGYWPNWANRPRSRAALVSQLKTLLENPAVHKVGHNLKFDMHMLRKLGIELAGWTDDTQLLAFAIDENMMEKSLDECVRRWVRPMAGYADIFNQTVDKSNMLEVPYEVMLPYAGGDSDAALRLYNVLSEMLARDPAQHNIYQRILMPAIRTFGSVIERHGMLVDRDKLRSFGGEVTGFLDTEYRRLIAATPAAVRLKHLNAARAKARTPRGQTEPTPIDAREVLKFSLPTFVRDVLFSPEGFNITPLVFTKGTSKLRDESEKLPSTSVKDHLPFFVERNDAAGEYCQGLIGYQKAQKLDSTYIGNETDGNGLWQYISPVGRIHPSYMLHNTVTGRTASANPNGQNFPKRGRWAKPYQKIFYATPGYKLVNCDLSQIELRIAAWMANEQTMLRIYREGGDIHTSTAQTVSQTSVAQWAAMSSVDRRSLRTKAKACIAAGSLVLTNNGLKPIENVTITDKLWDGVTWVGHAGVIYKGFKKVITYDGVTATPDHAVLDANGRKISIGQLAFEVDGPGIAVGAIAGAPVGCAYDHRLGNYTGPLPYGGNHLSVVRHRAEAACGQYAGGQDDAVPLSSGCEEPVNTQVEHGGPTTGGHSVSLRRHQTAMHQPEFAGVARLWGPGYPVPLSVSAGFHRVGHRELATSDLSRGADRPDQQRRSLRAWEYTIGVAAGEPAQHSAVALDRRVGSADQFMPTEGDHTHAIPNLFHEHGSHASAVEEGFENRTDNSDGYAHVYDIVNAGPRHIFTVNNRCVFNCNFGFLYGMGAKKFRSFAKTDYGITYSEQESYRTRDRFFETYSGLVAWHDRARQEVRANGFVRALHGAIRHLPSIYSNDPAMVASAERMAINSPVQRFGSDLGLMAMVRFSAQADPNLFRITGFVHDALVMEVRDGHEQEGIEALIWAMGTPMLEEWFGIRAPLPILADAEIGLNGGELLEFSDLPDPDQRPDWFNALGFDRVTPTKPMWWDDDLERDPERLIAQHAAR